MFSEGEREPPLDFIAELNTGFALSRFFEKALMITSPIISRIAIPETTKRGSSQPGGVSALGAGAEDGRGVVTIEFPGGTSVPTAENIDEALAVAIWVPFVTANTPVN